MTPFRFRTFYLSTLLLAGGLQLSCGSEGQEPEPIASTQQAVSCSTASDCAPYMDQCDRFALCYKPSLFVPGTCQFLDKDNGSACDDGTVCTQTDTCQSGVCVGSNPLPPQEACWDNAVDPAIPTTLYESTRFLWDGTGRIQTGVTATIDKDRAAVIRGQVRDRNGNPIEGVTVTVVDHTEYGSTTTLGTEGWFDLVVNGGGDLVVKYEKDGYLPVERKVRVPWKDYVIAADAAMTPEGGLAAQTVRCNQNDWQVVEGTLQGTGDAARKITLLFQPNTMFGATCADPTKEYGVRIVEYTTGEDGPDAMPAELPPTSAYTFAAELRIEDGSTLLSPEFNHPVLAYVENFVDFNIGAQVPSGYYDGASSVWKQNQDGSPDPEPENGVVLKIIGNSGGYAQIDAGLSPPAMSNEEKGLLAGLYDVDKELWRVPLWHFSTVDFNWPYQPPAGAQAPKAEPPKRDTPENKGKCTHGSEIICENQVLGERLPIAGTPFDLVYRSDRVPGYLAAQQLKIPLVGSTVPAGLTRIDLTITVAGRRFTPDVGAPAAQKSYVFTWDRKDIYDRVVNGAQPITVKLGYVYAGEYTGGQGFGNVGDGVVVSGDPTRQEVTFWREWKGTIGGWDATGFGLGGWSLDQLHAYSRDTQQLYRGDGSRRTAAAMGETIRRIMGGSATMDADGHPSEQTKLNLPAGIAFGPDGSLYVTERGSTPARIRKIDPSGIVSTVVSATTPIDVAVMSDGRLVFVEKTTGQVRRREANGVVETLSMAPHTLDGPTGIAVRPDGTIFVADTIHHRVLQRAPDGTVTVLAGDQNTGADTGDEGLAAAARFYTPRGLAVMADGSVLVADHYAGRVRRIDTSGYIHAFAGGGQQLGDGFLATDAKLWGPHRVAAAADGAVYVADYDGNRIRRIDTSGRIRTVAGTGDDYAGCPGDGGQATAAIVRDPEGIAVHPDGSVYYADENCSTGSIRRIAPAELGSALAGGWFGVPSEDGAEVYVFDDAGRHTYTRDPITGQDRFRFIWSKPTGASFYVPTSIEDRRGASVPRVTSVLRTVNGTPYQITSPTSKRTSLSVTSDGFLQTVTRPSITGQANSVYEMSYKPVDSGLLTTMWDPRDKTHRFTYNTSGKLLTDRDPYTLTGTAFKTLSRTELPSGDGYEVGVTTATNLTTTYQVRALDDGDKSWSMTGPDNRQESSLTKPDESSTRTYPDGTTVSISKAPDPRFGTSALVPSSVITLPSNNQLIVEQSRAVTPTAPTDPLTFDTLTQTTKLKASDSDTGLAYTATLDRTTSPASVVLTTPAGRGIKAELDSLGRPSKIGLTTSGVVSDVILGYDVNGRVTRIDQGTRRIKLAWDSSTGYLDSLWAGTTTDVRKYFVDLSIDARGQLGTITRNDNKQIKFGYDASSNLTLLQRPTDNASVFVDHSMVPNDVDLLSTYDAPDVPGNLGQTRYAWDRGRRLDTVTWADGTGVELTYFDPGTSDAGKLHELKTLSGQVLTTYGYETTSGRIAQVDTAQDVSTSFGWDGSALTSVSTTWPDAMSRSVSWGVGDYLRLATEEVSGAHSIAYQYDNDGLITHAITTVNGVSHDLSTPRHLQTGSVTATSLKKVSQALTYDSTYGQLQSIATTFNGVDNLHTMTLPTYDDLGRIRTKKERVLTGAETTTSYEYDDAGRLHVVTKGTTTTYGYDANGNRTTINGVTVASYDPQDRLLTYNGTTYTNNDNGHRTGKGSVGYVYDDFGNLTTVTGLPGNVTIEYDIDGAGRRVGKRTYTNGALTKDRRYVLGEGNRVVAEVDGSGTLISQFVYATRGHVPDFMIQGNNVYRFITDQLGSVRLVVNVNGSTAASSVVQQIEYDAWGQVTNTATAFDQPFGFAGGLWDRDTGLVHFGAREYDPVTARWLQKDPIRFGGGDTNLYAYVGGDPVNGIDPSGLTVYLCSRTAELFPDQAENMAWGLLHTWLWDSESGFEAGIGPAAGGWGGILGGVFSSTSLNDHRGAHNEVSWKNVQCEPQESVDEACVDSYINPSLYGESHGPWVPLLNDCSSFTMSVLQQCHSEHAEWTFQSVHGWGSY